MSLTQTTRGASSPSIMPLLLIACALTFGLYQIARFAGWWGEADSSAAARAIAAMHDTGSLVPGPNRTVYPNGFNYQAVSTFILSTTGLSLAQYKLFLVPLMLAWVVLPAWMLYREVLQSDRAAALATAFLLVQPEFIFVVLRGTHEKFTRGLMLICLYLFVRSLRITHSPLRMAAFVISFYLCIYAIIANNNLLGSSFIGGLGMSVVLVWLLIWRVRELFAVTRSSVFRLLSILAASIILMYMSLFFFYPPARHGLEVVHSVWDRVALLLLNVAPNEQTEGYVYTNPYELVNNGWISVPVYFVLSAANWLLLGISSIIWAVQGVHWVVLGRPPLERERLLLWAFFGGFAFQGALSILVDVSGALSSNLQHRIFPSFAMLAVPFLTSALFSLRAVSRHHGRAIRGAVGATIGLLAVLALWKATNEPLLSNKWPFAHPSEFYGLSWAERKLTGRSVWLGHDEQFAASVLTRTGQGISRVRADMASVNFNTRDFMISEVTRARSQRTGRSLPIEADSLITYDNGGTQIYHSRPRTAYQR